MGDGAEVQLVDPPRDVQRTEGGRSRGKTMARPTHQMEDERVKQHVRRIDAKEAAPCSDGRKEKKKDEAAKTMVEPTLHNQSDQATGLRGTSETNVVQ